MYVDMYARVQPPCDQAGVDLPRVVPPIGGIARTPVWRSSAGYN